MANAENEGAATEDQRAVVRAIHSTYLKLWAALFVFGVILAVAGEVGAPRLTLIGVGLAAVAFALGVVSWFARETTKHPTFTTQQLPSRYRIAAWSAVAVVVAVFVVILWYTLSRGLTSW